MNPVRRTLLVAALAAIPLLAPVSASAAPTAGSSPSRGYVVAPTSCYSKDRAASLACIARQPVVDGNSRTRVWLVGPGGLRRPLGAQRMAERRWTVAFFPAVCFSTTAPRRGCAVPARSFST